jgi:hypothetical protein
MDEFEKLKNPETHCFTYEVTMVVQVFAPNKEVADSKLDSDGGYVSERRIKDIRSTEIYIPAIEELTRDIDKREAEEAAKAAEEAKDEN